MGYRFSQTNRRISIAGASNIVTRLASRTVTGHEIPIHVHQHYALEFHLVLNPNTKSCIRRRFLNVRHARQLCYLLIDRALSGVCSCLFDNSSGITVVGKNDCRARDSNPHHRDLRRDLARPGNIYKYRRYGAYIRQCLHIASGCGYNVSSPGLVDAVEHCFRARPVEIITNHPDLSDDEQEYARWVAKIDQKTKKQRHLFM